MQKFLLESGIVVLLVLIGISIFTPNQHSNLNNVVVEFEKDIETGNIVEDGNIEDVKTSVNDVPFICKVNGKIANIIVNGLNSIIEIGIKILRKIIN